MNSMSKPTLYSLFRKTVKEILESPSEIPDHVGVINIEGGAKTYAEIQKKYGEDTLLKAFLHIPVERPPRTVPTRAELILAKETLEKMAKQICRKN